MQYQDSSSSSSDGAEEDYTETPLASGEQSAAAFRQSAARADTAPTPSSAHVGAVKTTAPAHVTTQLHSQLAIHSDDDGEEASGAAPQDAHAADAEAKDNTGFNSTAFMMRPSAAVVRKFNVLDSGDDDDSTYDDSQQHQHQHRPHHSSDDSDTIDEPEPTPSRNKGLRDGQNVAVNSSLSSTSASSSVREVRAVAPAAVAAAAPVVRRMRPPTPSSSSSSSSSSEAAAAVYEDASDSRTVEQLQPRVDLQEPSTATDTVPERLRAPRLPAEESSAALGSAAATAVTLEKMCPSSPSSVSSVHSSGALATVTDVAITAPTSALLNTAGATPETAGTGAETEVPEPARVSAGRMLPPPSTDSSTSGSSPVRMMARPLPPPPALTLVAPTFADDDDEGDEEEGREDGDVEDEEEQRDEEEASAVVFHDVSRNRESGDHSGDEDVDPAHPLDGEFPIQDWDPDAFAAMSLIDASAFSAVYDSQDMVDGEEDVVLESRFKVLDPFAGVWGDAAVPASHVGHADDSIGDEAPRLVRAAQREELNEAQRDLQRAASWMMQRQLRLADHGLTAPCGPDGAACCRGVAHLTVGSDARLLGELEVEPCTVPLSTVIAFASAAPCAADVMAILGGVTVKVALLHARELVHGALHTSNVLCSTDDGHITLTQPCGVLAQLALPADGSFISPREAVRLWGLVADIWGDDASATQHGRRSSTAGGAGGRLGQPVGGLDVSEKIKQHTTRLFTTSEEAWRAAIECQQLQHGPPLEPVEEDTSDREGDSATERRGLVLPWLGRALPEDDVYALGMLALALLTGVPAFHAVAMKDVLCTLAHLSHDATAAVTARANGATPSSALHAWVRETLVSPPCHTDMFQARASAAGYDEDFVDLCTSFITDCLCSGFAVTSAASPECDEAVRYHDATQLLQHPLFQQYLPDYTVGPDAMMADEDALRTVEEQVDRVHRYVYPVYSLTCAVETACGSAPYLPRPHRNAIFSARRQALFQPRANSARSTALAALWPSLEGKSRGWHTAHPSVTRCQRTRASGAPQAVALPSPLVCPQYFPAGTTTATAIRTAAGAAVEIADDVAEHGAVRQKKTLEGAKDCAVLLNLHTILFESEDGAVIRLAREDVAPLRHAVDKLVLRNLQRCRVEILTHFRYVVLDNVVDCEVILGPCFACHMRHVHQCPTIAVACTYMVLEDLSDCGIQFAGLRSPTAREGTVRDVRLQPYSVAYEGLAQDYAAVGLAAEYSATLPFFDASTGQPVRRALRYMQAGETTAQDFPYGLPLVATGNGFVHRDDNTSDVYVFYNELRGKDVFISHIHGDAAAAAPSEAEPETAVMLRALAALRENSRGRSTTTSAAAQPEPDQQQQQQQPRRPLIFVLDAIGDVKIEHCQHCTIFVVGASGTAEVRHCHDVHLFLLGRECVIEHCRNMHISAFITEFLAIVDCHDAVVEPLILQCPYLDIILEAVLHASVDAGGDDEAELQQALLAAYDAADMETLNVVLQGNGRSIEMSGCDAVDVHDSEWLAMNPSAALTMISIPVPALAFSVPSSSADNDDDDEEEEQDHADARSKPTSRTITACEFFARYCRRYRTTPQQFFVHTSFLAAVHASETALTAASAPSRPLVKIHNLLSASVLRVRGGLQLRGDEDSTTTAVPDLLLEQIHLGEVHIAEAVGNVLIRCCTGPLEIALAAAQHVVLDKCVNVTVRVACRSVAAQDCHHCHIAAHVNTAPCYLRCSSMRTSALNMTTEGMEGLLERVGVELDVNLFDAPVVKPPRTHNVLAAPPRDATTASVAGDKLHRYCSEEVVDDSLGMPAVAVSPSSQTPTLCVESLSDCFGLLCRPVTIVPPLPGLCVGVSEAAFLEPLEARVNREENQRIPLDSVLMAALTFLTSDGVDLRALDATTEQGVVCEAEQQDAAQVVDSHNQQHDVQAVVDDESEHHPVVTSASEEDAEQQQADSPKVGSPMLTVTHALATQAFADNEQQPNAAGPPPLRDSENFSSPPTSPSYENIRMLAQQQHPPAQHRYDNCNTSSASDVANMAPDIPFDSTDGSPEIEHGFAHIQPLTSSAAAEHNRMVQRIREETGMGESASVFMTQPLQVHHVDPAGGTPGRCSDSSLPPVGPGSRGVLGGHNADVLHVDTSALGSAVGSLAREQDPPSLDDRLAPPKSSIPTVGLSVASPPTILRAPVQPPLMGDISTLEPTLSQMGALQTAGETGHSASSTSVSLPTPVDPDDIVESEDSVNVGDASTVGTQPSSGEAHPHNRDVPDTMRKLSYVLDLEDNAQDDDAGDEGPAFSPYAPLVTIPYVEDPVESQRILATAPLDDDTRDAIQESLDELRSAKRAYQELLAETGDTFDMRVERALKALRANTEL